MINRFTELACQEVTCSDLVTLENTFEIGRLLFDVVQKMVLFWGVCVHFGYFGYFAFSDVTKGLLLAAWLKPGTSSR